MRLAPAFLAPLFVLIPILGLVSGIWILKLALGTDRKLSRFHLSFAALTMFALLGWCIFVLGGLPELTLTVGRAPAEVSLSVALSLCSLLVVLLWRPAFSGNFKERFAAWIGLPFPLVFIGHVLLYFLPRRFY